LPSWGHEWHCVGVNELRELRRDAHLTQQELADLLTVPVNTLRMWDSGLRRPPARVVVQARDALAARARRRQLLPLAILARELEVHVRTLQSAARTGRLETQFSVRSVFGRPMRFASREAGERFIAQHYRCFNGQEICRHRCRRCLAIMASGSRDARPTGPDPRCFGATHRCCRQSSRLSMGITEANTVAGAVATCSRTRTPPSLALGPHCGVFD
jgi:transcriptional regulator with XRE-family HTH domain